MKINERLKADLTLLLVTVFWGSAFAVLRIALENNVVFYLNGLRLVLGAALLFPLARWQKEKLEPAHLRPIALTGVGLTMPINVYLIWAFPETGAAGGQTVYRSFVVAHFAFIAWYFRHSAEKGHWNRSAVRPRAAWSANLLLLLVGSWLFLTMER